MVTTLDYGTTGLCMGQRVFGLTDWHRDGTLAEYAAIEARDLAPLPGDVDSARVGRRHSASAWRRSADNRAARGRWSSGAAYAVTTSAIASVLRPASMARLIRIATVGGSRTPLKGGRARGLPPRPPQDSLMYGAPSPGGGSGAGVGGGGLGVTFGLGFLSASMKARASGALSSAFSLRRLRGRN